MMCPIVDLPFINESSSVENTKAGFCRPAFEECSADGAAKNENRSTSSIIATPDNFDNRVNSMNEGFIKIPRSLLNSLSWRAATIKQRALLIEILARVVWAPTDFYVHGKIISLEKGQYCSSIRRMVEEFNPEHVRGKKSTFIFSKNDIERGLKYFLDIGVVRQEVRHDITIITVSLSKFYEEDKIVNETARETLLRQKRDTKEEDKEYIPKEKKKKKETPKDPGKIAFKEFVFLTQEQFDKLVAEHGAPFVEEMLEELNAYKGSHGKIYPSDYHTMTGRGWVLKKVKTEAAAPKQQKTIREKVMETFRNAEIYNQAECNITPEAISFTRGMTHAQLRFNEKGFWDQFTNILQKFGINNKQR